MDLKTAIAEASEIAQRDDVAMVVTENPYAEHASERVNFFPARATRIFATETVLARITPGATEAAVEMVEA